MYDLLHEAINLERLKAILFLEMLPLPFQEKSISAYGVLSGFLTQKPNKNPAWARQFMCRNIYIYAYIIIVASATTH